MKHINIYITEAWSGVKKQSIKADIEAWCDKMGIENYTINSKGEIDVNGDVDLDNENFEELPYKFGEVKGFFGLDGCKNLISLKNCPNIIRRTFHCNRNTNLVTLEGCPSEILSDFFCTGNTKLEYLRGCPKKVGGDFYCQSCGGQFDVWDVKGVCKVKGNIVADRIR